MEHRDCNSLFVFMVGTGTKMPLIIKAVSQSLKCTGLHPIQIFSYNVGCGFSFMHWGKRQMIKWLSCHSNLSLKLQQCVWVKNILWVGKEIIETPMTMRGCNWVSMLMMIIGHWDVAGDIYCSLFKQTDTLIRIYGERFCVQHVSHRCFIMAIKNMTHVSKFIVMNNFMTSQSIQ